MKEEFEMPEKWAVKINPNNYKTFESLRGGNLESAFDQFITSTPSTSKIGLMWGYCEKYIDESYTVITFEQFQKHVLGIEIEEPVVKDEDYSYLIPIMKELNII